LNYRYQQQPTTFMAYKYEFTNNQQQQLHFHHFKQKSTN